MGLYHSPKVATSGLVFMYDTGSSKSYKGEPTTNYLYDENAVAQASYTSNFATSDGTYSAKHPKAIRAYNAAGTQLSNFYNSGVTDAANTYHAHWQYDPILKKPVVVMNDVDGQWKAKSFNTNMGSWTSYGKGAGDKYTISWLQWVSDLSKNAKTGLYCKNTSSSNGFHDGQANSASSYNTKIGTWQRVYQTYTTSAVRDLDSTFLYIYMYGHYNVRAIVKVAEVQFNWGDYPVQFSAEYQRSATDTLKDRVSGTAIDLSNVSFDSNAQPTFDGTDDIINTGKFSSRNPSTEPFTIEAIVKSDITSGNRMWLDATSNGTNQRLYCAHAATGTGNPMGIQGSGWSSTTPHDTDYHHYVIVMDGSVATLYNNGEVHSTKSYTSYGIQALNIGGRSGYPWLGPIPVFKLYDRALTSDEVTKNFNAIRSRFGI